MATSTDHDIETLYYKKMELYEELAEIFVQERKSLETADLETLWKCSDTKQKISAQIVQVRKDILLFLDKAGIRHDMNENTFHTPKIIAFMPKIQNRNLQKIYVALIMIKNKVHALAEENKKFVTDYLGILDELIGIITNSGKPEPVYDNKKYCRGGKKTNLLLHKEV